MLAKECEAYRCKEFTSIYKLLSLKGKKALVTGGAGGIGVPQPRPLPNWGLMLH